MDPIIDTTDDPVDVLDDTYGYDRPVYKVKSDSEVYNKGTADDPVAVIIIITDDSEKESVTLNSVSQGKVTKDSIPREKSHHTHTGPEKMN